MHFKCNLIPVDIQFAHAWLQGLAVSISIAKQPDNANVLTYITGAASEDISITIIYVDAHLITFLLSPTEMNIAITCCHYY